MVATDKPVKRDYVASNKKAARVRRRMQEARREPGEIQQQLDTIEEQLRTARVANQQFAREKARRTDQYKALLQVANLLLAVASNEIIRRDDN